MYSAMQRKILVRGICYFLVGPTASQAEEWVQSRVLVLGPRCSVLGPWSLVLGPRFPVLGLRSSVPGPWSPVLGPRVPCLDLPGNRLLYASFIRNTELLTIIVVIELHFVVVLTLQSGGHDVVISTNPLLFQPLHLCS